MWNIYSNKEMKIVSFKGGLGNQIFEYFFYLYLTNNSKHKIYGYYNKTWLKDHNGLEIQNVFDVNLPEATYLSNFIVLLIKVLHKFWDRTSFNSNDKKINLKAIYFDGYWQNKKFYNKSKNSIEFKEINLNNSNKKILDMINNSNSVSIHVRRGDYLKNQNKYGNVCNSPYYKQSIKLIQKSFKEPLFFVFSDDMDWVKNNLKFENAVFVSENVGDNSYLDMYLMSFCKANIIANSSFSYWGAFLNKNSPMVIYPKKWYNNEDLAPDIFKSKWVGI